MMCLKQPKTSLLITIIIALIVLDQMTKQIAEVLLVYARPVEVLPFLDWTLLYNRGAAFSFLSDAGGWQRWFFLAISVVMSVVFAVWLSRTPKEQALMRYSLALIIAGAIGNLIDRAYLGHVIDFISVHWQNTHYFPAFNIADSAITIGTLLMMLDIILQPKSVGK
jgi:signal peptidase II